MSDQTWKPPQTHPHWLEVDRRPPGVSDETVEALGTLGEAARTHVVGRNIIEGRWSFQVVEEYDASYYDVVRSFAAHTEDALVDGARHVFESEMKDDRRTDGLAAQRRRPDPGS